MAATGGAVGFALHIDDEFLNKIQRADSMITDLANKSEQARTRVVEAFREMGDKGVGHFIQKLHEAQQKLDAIGNKTVNIDVTGIDKIGTQAANTADIVNKMLSEVNKISSAQSTAPDKIMPNIGQLKAEIDNINKQLTDANSKLTMEQQQTLVNTREFFKQVVAEQQKSTSQRLQEIQKLNEANKKANEEQIQLRRKVNEENIRSYQKDLEAERKSFAEREKVWINGFDEYDKKQRAIKDKEKKDAEERNKAAEKAAKENIKARNAQFNAFLKSIDNEAKAAEKADADMVKSSNKRMAQVTANLAKEEEARRKALTQVSAPQGTNTQSDVMMYSYYTYRIKELTDQMDALTRKTKEYEEAQKRIAAGKGGVLSQQEKTEYKNNLQKIKSIQDQIDAYGKLQQAIVTTNNTRMAQERKAQQFSNSMRSYLSDQQYSNEVLAKMRNFYAEEERLAAKAAAAKKQQAEEYKKTFEGAYQMYLSASGWKQEEEALKYLKLARKNLPETDSDFIRKKDALNAAIQQLTESIKLNWLTDKQITENITKSYDQHVKAIAREQKARERLNQQKEKEKVTSSTQNAMQYSAEAKSINEQVQAIKYLKIARDNLKSTNMTEEQYKQQIAAVNKEIQRQQTEVDKLRGKTDQLGKSHRNLMDISGQLQRRLALVFSVSQITGYMNKLVAVRGEFELQQKSLQVLLQNKDEANKLWQQTVDLAVKSPFRVGELVSYTRQLAAYRIETSKLFDTTKRLADVSAGLGVDMSRLILAYGQVRAANYLRGTELRQFTEAGIPMLDELAKRFTELEGRAVSAGDVFERISKRMVSFKDVEAVFRSMTDAGGTFFQMQEKQSETLKGMISNLHDTIDLMMNDIGASQEGILKGSVEVTNALVRDWRKWSIVLQDVGIALAGLKIAQLISALRSLYLVGIEATMAMGGMKAAVAALAKQFVAFGAILKAHPYVAIASTLLSAAIVAKQFLDLSKRLNNELTKIDINGMFDASKLSGNFKRLADIVVDTTKSYDEQKAALEQLRREYQDILPDQILTSKGLKDLQGDYDEITQSIYEYIAAKTKERKVQYIESEYGKDLENAATNMAKAIRKAIQNSIGEDVNISVSDLIPIVEQFRKGIEEGNITYENMNDELAKMIKLHTGLSANVDDLNMALLTSAGGIQRTFGNVESSATAFFNTIKRIKAAIDEVKSSTVSFGGVAMQQVTAVKDEYIAKIAEIKEAIDTIKINPEDPTALSKLDKLFNDIGLKAPEWKKIINDAFLLDQATMDANKAMYRAMIKRIWQVPLGANLEPMRANFVEQTEKELQKTLGTNQQKEVKRIMLDLSQSMKIATTGMDAFFMDSTESITEYANRIKSKIDDVKSNVKAYEKDIAQGTKLMPWSEEQYTQFKNQLPLMEAFLKYFDAFLDKDKKTTGQGKDWFAELAKNIKDANKEFMSLNQSFDKMTAKNMAMEKFKGVFEETLAALSSKGMSIQLGEIDFTTEEGSIEALKMLKDRLPSTAYKSRLEVEKALSDIKGEVDIKVKKSTDEQLKKDVQRIFDKYSLYLELKKLNVPTDLAKQMFDIDATDLEGVRKAIEEMKPQFKGTEMEKTYKDYLDKINQMEADAQIERTKTYVKYLMKSQSEAIKIKIEELRQIQEIQSQFEGQQAKAMIAGVQKESRQKMQKQQWTDFKNTDMYSMIFSDLENMGTQAIDLLYEKLNGLKNSLSDLPAESVKEIMTQIEKLQSIKIQRNPFKEIKTTMADINALQEQGRTEAVLQDELSISTAAAQAAQEQVDAIDLIMNTRDKDLLKQQMGVVWTEKYNNYLSMTTDELENNRDLQSSIVRSQEKIAKEATKDLNTYAERRKELEGMKQQWADMQSTFGGFGDSLMGTLEAVGVDSDSAAMAFAQMGVDLVDVVMQSVQLAIQLEIIRVNAIAAGTAMNTMLGVIGWVSMALQAVTKLFSAIFGMGDKKKQQQIEKLQDQVESLSKTYEKLTEAVDNAYSLNTLKEDTEEANRNLQRQITMYNQMIKLEEDKKKTDKDKIKGWRDEIASLQDEIAENNKKMVSTATDGILDSVLDASRSFTDAWLEAFQETGKGLSGLESEFKDMMQNLVKQQATMLITNQYVKSWKDALEQYINPQDLELTTDEAKRWVDTVTTSLPQLNQALENYFKAMQAAGVDLSGEQSGDSMSGLQRGIDSLSEATGEILASYLNSIRFFVAEQNTILTNISAKLLGDTTTENPMVTQLKIIAAQTSAINNLLNSCTRGGHRLGGMGLKIFMD